MAYRFLSISRIAIALSGDLEIVECDRVARGVHIAFLGEERYASSTLCDRIWKWMSVRLCQVELGNAIAL
jgi:hypothetical protein